MATEQVDATGSAEAVLPSSTDTKAGRDDLSSSKETKTKVGIEDIKKEEINEHENNTASTAPATSTASANDDDGNAETQHENNKKNWDNTSKKVVVHNVLKFLRAKELEKLVSSWLDGHDDLNIKIVKVKKPPRDNWVKVTLESEEMVEPFIKLINGDNNKDGEGEKNFRGKALFAKRAEEVDDEGNRKKRGRDGEGDGDGDGNENKRGRGIEERVLTAEEVRDAITPLWKMTYEEQLIMKWREMVKKCAMKIVKEVKDKFRTLEKEARRNPSNRNIIKLYDWVATKRAIEVEKPVPSPKMYKYRNKCEFTCGYHHYREEAKSKAENYHIDAAGDNVNMEANATETKDSSNDIESTNKVNKNGEDEAKTTIIRKKPAAGFLAGGWQGGVHPPHCLQNMPDWSCGLADIINEFHATSPIPPYDSKVHRGIWRTFTIRCSLRTKKCMVIVLHAPASGGVGAKEDGSDDYSNVFDREKKRLINMLTEGLIPMPKRIFPENHMYDEAKEEKNAANDVGIRVTSIFFQEYEGLSHPSPEHPVQHAFGKKSLEEKLGQCTFQISPGAFFQTNTEGAEKLYDIVVDRIREVTDDPEKTLMFDVCCGTGTIGLTCLKEGVVGRLVGVDISEPAIADAEVNAEKNGYAPDKPSDKKSITRFVASRAENVLADEMKIIPKSTPIVAVVDPARDGLHGTVVKTLRMNEKIQRLVYVSCNPTGTLVRDGGMLCAPPTKRYPGRPFKVTMAQPVDMFPLTSHCEMVMTFDRMSVEEYNKCHSKKDG
mmetsp:Transcript_17820/g.37134  ORF Transcript_17820/g.37134 Transcript_17820/m.37134 type:complete len:773 (-) Transcript_17820:352-2670(-)